MYYDGLFEPRESNGIVRFPKFKPEKSPLELKIFDFLVIGLD